jgi:hypothetical protein
MSFAACKDLNEKRVGLGLEQNNAARGQEQCCNRVLTQRLPSEATSCRSLESTNCPNVRLNVSVTDINLPKKVKLSRKGRGGLWNFQILRIPHCLDHQLTDGGEVVSFTCQLHSIPQKHLFFCFWYSFPLEALGLVLLGGLGKLREISDLIKNRPRDLLVAKHLNNYTCATWNYQYHKLVKFNPNRQRHFPVK